MSDISNFITALVMGLGDGFRSCIPIWPHRDVATSRAAFTAMVIDSGHSDWSVTRTDQYSRRV